MYLQPSDLAPLTDEGPAVVLKWITKAERQLASRVRQRGGNLAVLATDPDRLDTIREVLENAVLRALQNPEGLKAESEGDYSRTLSDASGSVWFPFADLDLVCPVSQGSAGTIALTLPSHRMVW